VTTVPAIILPLPFDTDLLRLHQLDPIRYPCLLESVAPQPGLARYDLLFAGPQQELLLTRDGQLRLDGNQVGDTEDFLVAFDRWWQREAVAECSPEWPFLGGWMVYLGYELLHQIEPSVASPPGVGGLPLASARRVVAAVMRDRQSGRCVAMAEPGNEGLVEEIAADVAALSHRPITRPSLQDPGLLLEEPPEQFLQGVARIKQYIREGDVFQVNLSRGWRWPAANTTAAGLYHALRRASPSPFAALWSRGEQAIISSSPERLVEQRGGWVATRPIAGTRPRSRQPGADLALQQELMRHPKERAEHVMLVDLERNDIGRVARAGTVEVNEFMVTESYSHVHHIVSNVRGELRQGVLPGETLRALFPGGTITGCPKVRCMQIISELEGLPRGAYTGSLGYINRNGDMDFNILIRSFQIDHEELLLRTGAGIVADSDPVHELAETRAKAMGMLAALGMSS